MSIISKLITECDMCYVVKIPFTDICNFVKFFFNSGDFRLYLFSSGKNYHISVQRSKQRSLVIDDGTVHSCSGICPHLGGVLQWNDDEKSFDCPLHGSRFTAYGTVINGPAICDLKKTV